MSGGETTAKKQAVWRKLELKDIESLMKIADQIHSDLPERREVFAEHVQLFPKGCLALVDVETNQLCGYAISHPIRYRHPPALGSVMGELASNPEQYYVHDVAILAQYQGSGYAQQCIDELLAVAKPYRTTGLVSAYGTTKFWTRHGFRAVDINTAMMRKLEGYGDGARWLERKNEQSQDI
ncbi:hypothetical protein EK21DRAFT_67124 [Setomelanomma holmii]|uniref:N-acetyltransferase domain-containing protein n=1 Tax=Setomelanomma holmii TaxID=210430 RepID=A0A9P4LLF2_9PLEO|nr:hypothetical protein EK21DRAFT_67124 [Setomelanomma holmii]